MAQCPGESPPMWSPSSGSEDYASCSDGFGENSPEALRHSSQELDLSFIISQSLGEPLEVMDSSPISHSQIEGSPSSKGIGTFIRKASRKFIPDKHKKDSKVQRNPSYQQATSSSHVPENMTHTVDGHPPGNSTRSGAKLSLPPGQAYSENSTTVIPRSLSFNAKHTINKERVPETLSISAGNSRQSSPCPSSSYPTMSPNCPASVISTSLDVASQTSQTRGFVKAFTSSITRQLSMKSKTRPKCAAELNGIPASAQSLVCYKDLLKLFECPGCLTLMNPPFYQCRKGHLVCDKCKIALKVTCPKCKQRITDETNAMMEEVCNLISFPCRFNKYGCSEFYRPKQKADHENFCPYRPVHCHFFSHGCQKILTVRDMKIHVDECQFKEFQD